MYAWVWLLVLKTMLVTLSPAVGTAVPCPGSGCVDAARFPHVRSAAGLLGAGLWETTLLETRLCAAFGKHIHSFSGVCIYS